MIIGESVRIDELLESAVKQVSVFDLAMEYSLLFSVKWEVNNSYLGTVVPLFLCEVAQVFAILYAV